MINVYKEWYLIESRLLDLFPDLPQISLEITTAVRVHKRNFADVTMGVEPIELRLHPELFTSIITRVRGVLTHESGHIADQLLDEEDLIEILGVDYTNDPERKADLLGEWVTGWHVYYDDDFVQRAGKGASGRYRRPRGL